MGKVLRGRVRYWPAAALLIGWLLSTQHSGGADSSAEYHQTDPPLPPLLPAEAIGSMSVGNPDAGYLFNAVRMPDSREWVLADPEHAWGTEETIRALMQAVRRVRERFPDTPPAVIGSLSAQFGGPYPPHRSHRTGRDADVHFYLIDRNRHGWYEPAKRNYLDRPRTWLLLKALITEAPVDFVLIDRTVQHLLVQHALSIGEDAEWIDRLHHGCGRLAPVIQHAPGHTGHMHIRFASPLARERGRREYDNLVRQGHIQLPVRRVEHTVEPGDTLLSLAHRYRTSIASIRELNLLGASSLRPAQQLVILERLPIAGARTAIEMRPIPLPGSKCSDGIR